MKVIINGKKYNTETACLKGELIEEIFTNEQVYIWYQHIELYQKFNGEFFLYEFQKNQLDAIRYEKIVPSSENFAKKFCENHLSVEQYEKIWGEVDE